VENQITNDREVVICPHCSLKQFVTVSGSCRKCRRVLNAPALWDKAITDAKKSIARLESAIEVFERRKKAGEPWPATQS
jgi:hypothetical protein